MESLNYNDVQTLVQVRAFLNFIKDPASAADAVKSVSDTLDRMETIIDAYTTVQKAQDYLEYAQGIFTNADVKAKAIIADAQAQADELTKAANTNLELTEDKKQDAMSKQALATAALADAQDKQAKADQVLQDANALANDLAERGSALADAELVFNAKAQQLKGILG